MKILRTIKREIVGPFIFSNDNHILLGHNRPGGVFDDCWVAPGGGIDENETKLEALKRETLEEVGIDITNYETTEIELDVKGSSEKTLKQTGEKVIVDMVINNFKVEIPLPASQIPLKLEDDFVHAEWVPLNKLSTLKFSPTTEVVLKHLKVL